MISDCLCIFVKPRFDPGFQTPQTLVRPTPSTGNSVSTEVLDIFHRDQGATVHCHCHCHMCANRKLNTAVFTAKNGHFYGRDQILSKSRRQTVFSFWISGMEVGGWRCRFGIGPGILTTGDWRLVIDFISVQSDSMPASCNDPAEATRIPANP